VPHRQSAAPASSQVRLKIHRGNPLFEIKHTQILTPIYHRPCAVLCKNPAKSATARLYKCLRFFLTSPTPAPISTDMPKAKPIKKIKCAARDCDVMFFPRVKGQKFHITKCYNRESQRIHRERQKAKAATA
jgi:hypothetical protein